MKEKKDTAVVFMKSLIKAVLLVSVFAFSIAHAQSDVNQQSNPLIKLLQGVQAGLQTAQDGVDKAKTQQNQAFEAQYGKTSFTDLLNGEPLSEWPRVALTIHQVPGNFYDSHGGRALPPDFCVRVSAVVWKNATTSTKIPEENFCVGHSKRPWQHSAWDFALWSTLPAPYQHAHTGIKRTNGPTPPNHLFPDGMKYKGRNGIEFAVTSGGVWAFSLAAQMGFDISIEPGKDRRFWIVSMPGQFD